MFNETSKSLRILVWATVLSLPLMAEGFNTCTIAQSDITTRSGVERPVSRAYDSVCLAVLPPGCRNYTVDHQPCAYRACLVSNEVKRCPDGQPTAYTAMTIATYVAKTVRPFTKEERDAMNHGIDAAAQRLAAKWTDNGRVPLAPGADKVLHNVSCELAAFGNPDVRCVPQ